MDNFGKPIFSNSIALGAMAKLLERDLDKNQVLASILAVIPKYHKENKDAFQLGFESM